MCGIVGLVNYTDSKQLLPMLLSKIINRGPDASGEFYSQENNVALGHRRLSVIDLSDVANQPFQKYDWVIIFNGEIYNYLELRKELSANNIKFYTNSDTEVLLEAWRFWGPECLNRLRGMFAFAIYNKTSGQLFLARDHYGVKPLFLYQSNNQLAFASEIKALLPVVQDRQINYSGIIASLLYVWLPDSQCIYQNIKKFPAGAWAEVRSNGDITYHSYYLLEHEASGEYDKDFNSDELERILLDSVEKHLHADVPVSTFLSGGLDSSLLTAMAAKLNPKIDCYTITFTQDDKRFEAVSDDLIYAERLAKKLGLTLHKLEITSDIVQMLPEIVNVLDEPIGDAAAINTYLICKSARERGVKVLLSGMGADELFAGYRKHYACMLASNYRKYVPQFIREHIISPLVRKLPVAGKNAGYQFTRWAQRFCRFADLPEEQAFLRSYSYYSLPELQSLLNPELYSYITPVLEEHYAIYWQHSRHDQINRMCLTDVELFMKGLNLTYTDRASMAASTEVRVPFIDKEVVKAAFKISGKQKLQGNEGKYILKKLAEKWLPHEIIYRPKAGFGAPLRSWIRRDLAHLIEDYVLSTQGLAGRGLFKVDYLKQMVVLDRNGKVDYSQQLWQLLTLEQWFRTANL